ncbi:MAG: HAD family hydrolase [Oscillospiraceae bacterium]|nr:HAD family hydrolase [Oscillospiraceae bacterium]
MKYDSIIFDLDGTLWDSAEGICGVWDQVIAQYPGVDAKISVEELHRCMGHTIDEIAVMLFPDTDPQLRCEMMKKCCSDECEYLSHHGGTLYGDHDVILGCLAEKYKLFIVSNCQCGYIESYLTAHNTKKYFTDIECIGNTGLSKGENISLVIKRNNLKHPVYVGDTQTDADAAHYAGIDFVFAQYGFGNVEKYEYAITSLDQLQNTID